ncbi:MAG: 50S ribosomal protein L9 [Flavobacteriales bacterium]|jgi:large subunit ribosomal protein L9|nr:50S ribosomal protein L9 [Flavobacteriales bacterium]|tara:strand:+ start:496 stop:939 length:444 start_codon:yes stop_codon:yes gene_type:complete
MNVILLENVEKLGFKNEVIKVKAGYGRNFLIPTGKAILATESSVKVLNENLRQQEQKDSKLIAQLNKTAEALPTLDIQIKAKVAEGGTKIFGSIKSSQFTDALSALGHDIDKRFVKLSTIKELGNYEAEVRLHRSVMINVPFSVVAE